MSPIKLFNHGRMRRDFTYVGDVTRVILRLVDQFRLMTAGGRGARRGFTMSAIIIRKSSSHVVAVLEKELGRTAVKDMLPMQPGDVTETFADVADLMRDTGFRPQTSIEDGIRDFVAWYRDHYKV